MTYVLMTRPEEDCQAMATQLSAPMVCEPLLIIHPCLRTLDLDPLITDLIITSPRVLDIIENIQIYRTMPVWCVGDVTAKLAKDRGFETIHVAPRSAQELLEKIVQENPRDKSFFVHLRGDIVHVDITSALNHVGFHAESILVYDTQASSDFSPRVKRLFEDHCIGLIPFYSLGTAEIFGELVKKTFSEAQIPSIFNNCRSLAHSEAIAQKLKDLPWRSVEVVSDLGAQQIDAIYLQYYGTQEEEIKKQNQTDAGNSTEGAALFVSPGVNRSKPSASPSSPSPRRRQILAIAGLSLLASLMGVFLGLISVFMLPPSLSSMLLPLDKIVEVSKLHAESLKSYGNSLADHEQRLEAVQRAMGEKTTEQSMQISPISDAALSELKEDVSQIKKEIGFVIDRLNKLEESSLINKQASTVHEPSPDYQALMTYQRLLRCQHNLLVSEVLIEDQQFLLALGIQAQDLWSIPQLLDHLEPLELGYSTVQSPDAESVMGQVMRKLDIKVQHKANVSLKESIVSDLKKSKFTFLDIKILTPEIVSQLSPEGLQWLDKVRQTAQVKEQIEAKISSNLLATPLSSMKPPVNTGSPAVINQSPEDSSIIMETPAELPLKIPEDLSKGQG